MSEQIQKEGLAIEAAKYLIQLYMSTQYQCNRQKLQKLILFAHFALKLDGKEGLLNHEPVSASSIGLGIESVSTKFYNLVFNRINQRERISTLNKKENSQFAPDCQYSNEELKFRKDYLKKFFIEFGAYDKDTLSEVTKKFTLYPLNADFSNAENGIISLADENVENFIHDLKSQHPGKSGFDIICEIISKNL